MFRDNKDRLRELAEKWLNKTISNQEKSEFDRWYNQVDEEPQEIDQSKAKYRDYLFTRIKQETGVLQARPLKLWPKIVSAAAAVAAIVVGVWFYTSMPDRLQEKEGSKDLLTNDIAPGKNTATITFSDGSTLMLSDAKTGITIGNNLRYYDGTKITNRSLDKMRSSRGVESSLKLSTPRGGTYQVTLSDGTKIWLNAASSLTYSISLNKHGQRRVKLDGEAYFEVSKDKSHPFIVESAGQEVEVLGTHFNISSYKDEASIKTTLLEGSVKVSYDLEGGRSILKPGEQAVVADRTISIVRANAEEVLAWKDGQFVFYNEELGSIMKKIARWYDVEISYQKPQLSKESYWGSVSRFRNVSDVLNMLEHTGKVKFKIDRRKIFVQEK